MSDDVSLADEALSQDDARHSQATRKKEEVMEKIEVQRNEGPEGSPGVTAAEQARKEAEAAIGRGASVLHLGSSAIGLNLNLTDAGRRELLGRLEGSLVTLARRHGVEYTPPSKRAANEEKTASDLLIEEKE